MPQTKCCAWPRSIQKFGGWSARVRFRALRHVAAAAIAAGALIATAAQAQFTVYLVRHGQTDWNREARIQGSTDNQLNATGLEQAAVLGRTLTDIRIDADYTSSLQRTSTRTAARS